MALLKHKQIVPHLARQQRKQFGSPAGHLTCSLCGANNASKNRQRTMYPNPEDNIEILCPQCQQKVDEYWDDMWDEYYYSL